MAHGSNFINSPWIAFLPSIVSPASSSWYCLQNKLVPNKLYWLIAQLCLTLLQPLDCRPPDSSGHGILQARIVEWVASPPLGDLPDAGMEPPSLALQADSLLLSHQGSTPTPNKLLTFISFLQGLLLGETQIY